MKKNGSALRVLVTGATGFIARSLIPSLAKRGHIVVGLCRRGASPALRPGLRIVRCDLTGPQEKIFRSLREAKPDAIVHLAAQVPGRRSMDEWALLDANARATNHLLTACMCLPSLPCVVVVSSSAVYGPGKPGEALTEAKPFSPVSHYGISKVLAEMVAVRAAVSGLPVVRARLFNVIGPGQEGDFVVPSLARRVASIEAGLSPPEMEVMSSSSFRDFVDVRDVAAALALLVEKGRSGKVYNVCSGGAVKIGEVLRILLSLARLEEKVRIRELPDGPNLVPYQRGNAARILRLGWRPRHGLRRSLADTLQFFRAEISQERPRGYKLKGKNIK